MSVFPGQQRIWIHKSCGTCFRHKDGTKPGPWVQMSLIWLILSSSYRCSRSTRATSSCCCSPLSVLLMSLQLKESWRSSFTTWCSSSTPGGSGESRCLQIELLATCQLHKSCEGISVVEEHMKNGLRKVWYHMLQCHVDLYCLACVCALVLQAKGGYCLQRSLYYLRIVDLFPLESNLEYRDLFLSLRVTVLTFADDFFSFNFASIRCIEKWWVLCDNWG